MRPSVVWFMLQRQAGTLPPHQRSSMTAAFWPLWAVNAAIAAVLAWFFLEGLGDGTIQAGNLGLWLLLLALAALILAGSQVLHRHRPKLATVLIAPTAIGAIMFVAVFALVYLSGERMN
jgi:hypothetical protein